MEVYILSWMVVTLDSVSNANSVFCLVEQRLVESNWETSTFCTRLPRESLFSRWLIKYSQIASNMRLTKGIEDSDGCHWGLKYKMTKTRSVRMGYISSLSQPKHRFWNLMKPELILEGIRRQKNSSKIRSRNGLTGRWSTPRGSLFFFGFFCSSSPISPKMTIKQLKELWRNGNPRTPNQQGKWTGSLLQLESLVIRILGLVYVCGNKIQ